MKTYIDTESGCIVSEDVLMAEFEQLKAEQPEEYPYSFPAYILNCTSKNGFLMEV